MPNKRPATPQSKASNLEDYWIDRRSWLIDTAETKEDQKNLPRDLARLDQDYARISEDAKRRQTKKGKK